MQYKLLVILSFVFIFSACKNDALIKSGDTVDVAYEKALAFYQNGDYRDAATAFETVTRIARGTEYGQEAQYYLAESYYNSRQYLLAASEYDRYISYYPQDERREEMEFKSAMCYYHQSPRYKLDQTATRNAIERFQLFNNRYPDSDLVIESAARIDELREKLAHKTFDAAEFYIRTERYEAGVIYMGLVIDRYPETEWAEHALVSQVKTYIEYADKSIRTRQAERYTLAIDAYEKFLQLFPESDLRSEIENLYDEAQRKLASIEAVTQNESEES